MITLEEWRVLQPDETIKGPQSTYWSDWSKKNFPHLFTGVMSQSGRGLKRYGSKRKNTDTGGE